MLVVAISFVLAFFSMKDYHYAPQVSKGEYGLFLIRQTANLNVESLRSIGHQMLSEGLIVSIERLFKGPQAALTIFGPRKILGKFMESLNLLELEDYAEKLITSHISIWEVGARNPKESNPGVGNFFEGLSQLRAEDQFFWQVILGAKKGEELTFQTQIRAAVYTLDAVRKNQLVSTLQNLSFGSLIMVPKPFSTDQMMDFFKSRSLSSDASGPILSAEGVINLLKV